MVQRNAASHGLDRRHNNKHVGADRLEAPPVVVRPRKSQPRPDPNKAPDVQRGTCLRGPLGAVSTRVRPFSGRPWRRGEDPVFGFCSPGRRGSGCMPSLYPST